MNKQKINQMAEVIIHLKLTIHPLIMKFSLEEWDEIKEHLSSRYCQRIQAGSIIIDAMGGNSHAKELQARFQCELFEAIHSYATHLHKANDIAKELRKASATLTKNKKIIDKVFG